MLTSLPGIGPKTAKRIIIELRDEFGNIDSSDLPLEDDSINNDAFLALKNLGFLPHLITKAINKIVSKSSDLSTEEIIKKVLESLALKSDHIKKYTINGKVIKIIVVPNKLVNVVVAT